MAADPSSVFGTITGNLLPSGSVILSVLIVLFFMFCSGIFLWVMATKHRWPVKYKAIIFEKFGNFRRPLTNKLVIFKRKQGQEGYYIDKRKVALSIEDAELDQKNRPIFFLDKFEDRYIPIRHSEVLLLLDKDADGKDIVKAIPASSFLAESRLSEYEEAIRQAAINDAKKYKWMDKLGPLVLVGVPMVILLISFFLTAWSVKGQQANLAELQQANAKQDAVIGQLGELVKQMSESNTLVAKYLGEVRATAPTVPPG